MTKNLKKGSITVETAIALPIFICVIVTIILLLKVFYVHFFIQHAIDEAAADFASAMYLTNLLETDDNKSFSVDIMKAVTGYSDIDDEEGAFYDSIIKKSFEALVFPSIVRSRASLYMSGSNLGSDEMLRFLNVRNGLSGLDFTNSQLLKNGDIVINVEYVINLPVPLKVIPPLKMGQSVKRRAWLAGDGEIVEQDIWSMSNLERGKTIHEIFRANLPFNFPKITSVKNGCAILFRSIDLTASSYQNISNAKKNIISYIEQIETYEGQKKPWGDEGIVIFKEDIQRRELLLIIPRNEFSEEMNNMLNECRQAAQDKNVTLRIVKYGYKSTATGDHLSH